MTGDILLDKDGDLLFSKGDLVIGPSEEQHLHHLLISETGHWKHDLFVGVDIAKTLKSTDKRNSRDKLEQRIRLQMEYDNWKVEQVDISNLSNIQIAGTRKS